MKVHYFRPRPNYTLLFSPSLCNDLPINVYDHYHYSIGHTFMVLYTPIAGIHTFTKYTITNITHSLDYFKLLGSPLTVVLIVTMLINRVVLQWQWSWWWQTFLNNHRHVTVVTAKHQFTPAHHCHWRCLHYVMWFWLPWLTE